MKILNRMLWLIPFTLAGVGLAYMLTILMSPDRLIKWESLGAPPTQAVKIVALDYVQTRSGLLYHYEHANSCADEKYCWVETKTLEPQKEPLQPVEQAECIDYHPPLTDSVDAKAVCLYYPSPNMTAVIEAIDKDGGVYSWSHMVGKDGTPNDAGSLYGGIAGFVIGLFVVTLRLFFDWTNWLQKKAQKNSENRDNPPDQI